MILVPSRTTRACSMTHSGGLGDVPLLRAGFVADDPRSTYPVRVAVIEPDVGRALAIVAVLVVAGGVRAQNVRSSRAVGRVLTNHSNACGAASSAHVTSCWVNKMAGMIEPGAGRALATVTVLVVDGGADAHTADRHGHAVGCVVNDQFQTRASRRRAN